MFRLPSRRGLPLVAALALTASGCVTGRGGDLTRRVDALVEQEQKLRRSVTELGAKRDQLTAEIEHAERRAEHARCEAGAQELRAEEARILSDEAMKRARYAECGAKAAKTTGRVGLLGCVAGIAFAGPAALYVCGASAGAGKLLAQRCGVAPRPSTREEVTAKAVAILGLEAPPSCGPSPGAAPTTTSTSAVALEAGSTPTRSTSDAIAAIEAAYRQHDERLRALYDDYERLSVRARAVADHFHEASVRFQAAAQTWEAAERSYDRSTPRYEAARRDFDEAERMFRQAATLAVVAASSGAVCASTRTTSRYRRELADKGFDLSGMDVDHVFPRSKGGIDHPLNFEVMESSLNRSLGADLYRKLLHAPVGMLAGLAVSALGHLGGCG